MATNVPPTETVNRAGWREPAFCAEAGIGRTKMWAEVKAGRIKAKKSGRATIIVTSPREAAA